MQWILQKFDYDIKNPKGDCNRWPCIVDIIFLILYTIISIFNTIIPILPEKAILFLGKIPSTLPTFSIIVINIIILFRINLCLYIKNKDNLKRELERLRRERIVATKIIINTWRNRFVFLMVGYVADALITLYYIFYGSSVAESLVLITVIAVIETLINDFVDNLEIMYEAVPNVYRKV